MIEEKNQNTNNQTYTLEKKEGIIVKIEDSQEIQKQQKHSLKIAIGSFCAAIAVAGAVTTINNYVENSNTNNVVQQQSNDSNLMASKDLYQSKPFNPSSSILMVCQIETKVLDQWIKGNIFILNEENIPNIDVNTTIVLLGFIPSNTKFLYQKEIRNVTYNKFGVLQINSEWIQTNEYIASNKDDIPEDTIDTRYILVWSNEKQNTNEIDDSLEEGRSR